MTIPLYQQHNAPNGPPEMGHFGLWYTRFFNRYTAHWTLDETAKSEWVSSMANKRCGDDKILEQHSQRLVQLVTALEGQFAICQTNWHFATGLGLPHPVENGLAWHPTLGVPYLAGSAIKGLLRAWVEVWDDSLSDSQRLARRQTWFGMVKEQPEDEQDQAGKLIFFDAIPITPLRLTTDIMTPHYGKWYEQGHEIKGNNLLSAQNERLPADWHEPVPVPFLAVKSAKFLIAIAARDAKKDKALVDSALESLLMALQWLGAGAKTAAGYGHFERNEKAEKALWEELNKKPEPKKEPAPDFIAEVLKESPAQADYITLSQALEKGRWKDNPLQQKAVAEFVKKRMEEKNEWREKSAKKNPKKDKNYQRTLKVIGYLQSK